MGLTIFGVFFFLTLYMQQVLGFSPLKAGFAYVPFTLSIPVSSGLGSVLMGRIGAKGLLVAGLVESPAELALPVRALLQLVAEGLTNKEIVRWLIVTEHNDVPRLLTAG